MTGERAVATVYWRQGCPYCSRLLGDLDRIGLPVDKVNIWEDPEAAATVRSIADGNETVPTVVVGDTAMVNPRAADVVDAARRHTPGLLAVNTSALVKGPWHRGLAVALVIAVGWFVLAAFNPTTSFPLAPALLTAAWPLGRRWRAGRVLRPVTALTTALGGAVLAVAIALLLELNGALAGAMLFGMPPLTEAIVSVALGVLVGGGLALAGRRPS
ncbi:glutaredoxin domain-containing protein [Amycolatopsis suaedae]|uniref:Glutaredoxin n=1 Tax=Amycolatopsis suaedae TaxID=2510978 RepID=A0A4Q7J0R2_9PSEU|nr:glutaredoxin domain-containing protein [Amycolatopsis suaedae]RZQ59524.1 glutaredoxin [Amycolatopsis suaedae]